MTVYLARIRVSDAERKRYTQAPFVATAEVWPENRADMRRARTGLGWTHGVASSRAVEAAFAALDGGAPERKPVHLNRKPHDRPPPRRRMRDRIASWHLGVTPDAELAEFGARLRAELERRRAAPDRRR